MIDVDALTAFYLMIDGGTLLNTNAPEAQLLSETDPNQPIHISRPADALISTLTTMRTK